MIRTNWVVLVFFLNLFIFYSCSPNDQKSKTSSDVQKESTQLNISFLLDLSDRIDPSLNPEQSERDQEAIFVVEKYFKNQISNKNAHFIEDKIRVIFHPRPENKEISQYADSLNINFGEEDANKKEMFEKLDSTFKKYIPKIYSLATKREKYEGSDIWHFVKDDIHQKCIIDKSNYRNILVILTDGYMFWPYDKRKINNRYNYITGRYNHFNQFRNSKLLKTKFEEEDYGFIKVHDKLDNLEILVVGIAPPKKYPQDFEIIKRYWEKWFDEMNVKDYTIIKSEFSSSTEESIQRFFSK